MNEIVIYPDGSRQIVGEGAHNLAFSADWRATIATHAMQDNRFYVFEQKSGGGAAIMRAAQSTIRGAHSYMNEDRVLVYFQTEQPTSTKLTGNLAWENRNEEVSA